MHLVVTLRLGPQREAMQVVLEIMREWCAPCFQMDCHVLGKSPEVVIQEFDLAAIGRDCVIFRLVLLVASGFEFKLFWEIRIGAFILVDFVHAFV